MTEALEIVFSFSNRSKINKNIFLPLTYGTMVHTQDYLLSPPVDSPLEAHLYEQFTKKDRNRIQGFFGLLGT